MGVNFVLLLYLIAIAPKMIVDWILKGKKHPGLLNRFGIRVPDSGGKPVIWIHAVSVGEAKASRALALALKKEWPSSFFLVTTTTATGHEEAKRSIPADAYCYVPLDFTWVVRRWVRRLKPQLFLLIESDFWPNLLREIQASGGKNILISGKISLRSAQRLSKFPFFSRKLFGTFDAICVQNEDQRLRFAPLVPDAKLLHITGNIKLNMLPEVVDSSIWNSRIPSSTPVITIASTHNPEEDAILNELKELDLFIFLAPRHPERCKEIEGMLKLKQIPYVSWTKNHLFNGEKLVLVDVMGQLPQCYSLSRIAILGGSFFPGGVGGHNVFEPCLYKTPAFFGPYMDSQTEISELVQKFHAGMQLPLLDLKRAVIDLISNPIEEGQMKSAAQVLSGLGQEIVATTVDKIHMVLNRMPNII